VGNSITTAEIFGKWYGNFLFAFSPFLQKLC
jgi:hypothetical protein